MCCKKCMENFDKRMPIEEFYKLPLDEQLAEVDKDVAEANSHGHHIITQDTVDYAKGLIRKRFREHSLARAANRIR